MSRGFDREAEVAERLAREAGAILLEVTRKGFTVGYKGPRDPVTEGDLRASAHIVAGLKAAFPEDGVISEEAAPSGAFPRRVWFVDPMDGTQQFVDGGAEYAVMIGLAEDGRPVVGAVYQPAGDCLWLGAPGVGAWKAEAGRRAERRVSAKTAPGTLTLAVSRSHRSRKHDDIRAALGVGGEVVCGSVGLKVGLIVDGRADLYVEPSANTWAWDTCGPEAILRAAGGSMSDMRGAPLRYDPAALRNAAGVAASNGACHAGALAALARLKNT